MTLIEHENELKNTEAEYISRTSGKREMLSDMWNTGRFFARDRWNAISCTIKRNVHPEFLEGLLIGSGFRLAGKALAGSAPVVAIGVGAAAGGATALWKEGARIAREKKAEAEGIELKDVKLDFKEKVAYWRSGEIMNKDNARRLVAATATGAVVGGVGAFIGHEVTGFVADHAGEWIEAAKNTLSQVAETITKADVNVSPIPFVQLKLSDIRNPLEGLKLPSFETSQTPSPDLTTHIPKIETTDINYIGSDQTYAHLPDVGPNFSSLTGWEQAQVGQMILGDLGIKSTFDPYNPEHLKLLYDYMEKNPEKYARQMAALADFVRSNNNTDIFHPKYEDLIAHGKSIKVPVNTVDFLRKAA